MATNPPLEPGDPGFVPPVGGAYEDDPQMDYFGFEALERYTFPDNKSWLEFKIMNEGDKSEFQKRTQRDVVVEKTSGNARFNVDPSTERHQLILTCVTDWNLRKGGQAIALNKSSLGEFLKKANPKIVEDVELAIRKANPWLQGDMTADDIRAEIKNLEEQLVEVEKREAGKAV